MREAPEYGKHSPHAARNLRTACDGRRCRSPASSRRQSRRRAPTAADMPPPFRQNPAGRRRSGRLPANRPARTAVFRKQPRKSPAIGRAAPLQRRVAGPSDGRRPATKQSPAGKAPQSAARDGGEPQTVFARNTFAYGHLVRNGDNPRDSPKLPGGSIVRRSRRKPGTGPGRPTAKPSVCQGIVLHGERHDASGRGICRHTAGAD